LAIVIIEAKIVDPIKTPLVIILKILTVMKRTSDLYRPKMAKAITPDKIDIIILRKIIGLAIKFKSAPPSIIANKIQPVDIKISVIN
jgi:hypothetical protein